MTGRFGGRRALITGASRGIGAAVALQLAADGADVAIVARSVEPHQKIAGSLNETAERIRQLGSRCVVIGADLSNDEDRSRIVPEAIDGLGGLDILVNNAAAAIYQPPETYSLKHRRLSMEVNYHAPADLMQALVPHLTEAGEGWIVNLTSSAANPTAGPPFVLGVQIGLYGATKAALNRLTNAMGASLYGTGVACERGHAPGGRAQRGGRHPRRRSAPPRPDGVHGVDGRGRPPPVRMRARTHGAGPCEPGPAGGNDPAFPGRDGPSGRSPLK